MSKYRVKVAVLLLLACFVSSWTIGPAPMAPAPRLARPGTTNEAAARARITPIARRSLDHSSRRFLLNLPNEEDIDAFLDSPFYDPDKVLEDEDSSESSKRFARFVKNDYETAEALLSGAFFVILVIVSQELLRMHIYGSEYAPFT
jgi:hypothetical protein